MDADTFITEFTRINADFDTASQELARLGWWRYIRQHTLFTRMRRATLEMEMLGKRTVTYAEYVQKQKTA